MKNPSAIRFAIVDVELIIGPQPTLRPVGDGCAAGGSSPGAFYCPVVFSFFDALGAPKIRGLTFGHPIEIGILPYLEGNLSFQSPQHKERVNVWQMLNLQAQPMPLKIGLSTSLGRCIEGTQPLQPRNIRQVGRVSRMHLDLPADLISWNCLLPGPSKT